MVICVWVKEWRVDEVDWDIREKLYERGRDMAIKMLYFLVYNNKN